MKKKSIILILYKKTSQNIKLLLSNKSGALTVMTAFAFMALTGIAFAVIELLNLHAERLKSQHIADNAALGIAKHIDDFNSNQEIEEAIENYINAYQAKQITQKTQCKINSDYQKSSSTDTLNLRIALDCSSPTIFSNYFGLSNIQYTVIAKAEKDEIQNKKTNIAEAITTKSGAYGEIYFLIDDSASMLVAADGEDADKLLRETRKRYEDFLSESQATRDFFSWKSYEIQRTGTTDYDAYVNFFKDFKGGNKQKCNTESECLDVVLKLTDASIKIRSNQHDKGCMFGCHSTGFGPFEGTTLYKFAKEELKIKFKIDNALEATKNILKKISDTMHNVRAGLYFFSEDVYETNDISTQREDDSPPQGSILRHPTSDLQRIFYEIESYQNVRIDRTTDFLQALTTMKKLIGSGGSGSSWNESKKLIIMITDGVDSISRKKLAKNAPAGFPKEFPIKPSWCQDLKDSKVTLAVLYTTYPDARGLKTYEESIGQPMKRLIDYGIWKTDEINPNYTTNATMREYLPAALKDCASVDFYAEAKNTHEIFSKIEMLFERWNATSIVSTAKDQKIKVSKPLRLVE